MAARASVLLACTDAAERATYRGWLEAETFHVVETDSLTAALGLHRERTLPLTLAEAAGSTRETAALVQTIRAVQPGATILILGSSDTLDTGIAAVRAGATDLLLRPVTRAQILARLGRIGTLHPGLQHVRRLRDRLFRDLHLEGVVAHSPAMLDVLALVGQVAVSDTTVLLTGESGTGKDLVAQALHANSARARRPMVSLNCAAIPEALLESELFGYRRGAFTGAHADKAGLLRAAHESTLFLDEIADLPGTLQAKLLRFLQDGTYLPLGALHPERADTRLITATNAPLRQRVEHGAFRRDLYYRLSVFPIHVPPLRRRPEDVLPLAQHFVRQSSAATRKGIVGLSRDAALELAAQHWDGNVRELANSVERATVVAVGPLLTAADLTALTPGADSTSPDEAPLWQLPAGGVDLPALNRALVLAAYRRARQNVSAAARLLGLSRPALRYRLRKYGAARS